MPWGRAGLDVVVTTDGDRDVFLVFMGASTGLEPAGARFMMRAEPLLYYLRNLARPRLRALNTVCVCVCVCGFEAWGCPHRDAGQYRLQVYRT